MGQQGQQVCAQTCNQLNGLIQYQPGYTYTYRVNLDTKIDSNEYDLQQEKVQISAISEVSVYAPCEMVLRLRQVELSGIKQAPQMARQLEEETLHFAYDDGQVVDVCASLNEHTWALNVKKSIISALQMSSTDLSQKKTVSGDTFFLRSSILTLPLPLVDRKRHQWPVRDNLRANRVVPKHFCCSQNQGTEPMCPATPIPCGILPPILRSGSSVAICIANVRGELRVHPEGH